MNNNRLTYWDIGAGVMIIWLLYFHALFPMLEGDILRDIPWFFFFMPWFFYKSGYFFNPKAVKENSKKDAKKLLKQFAIWSAIGYVCYILHHAILTLRVAFYTPIRSLLLGGSIPMNNALWFLLTLFVVRFIANMALPKMNALVISIVSMLVACFIRLINYHYMPFTLYSATWGLCFFCAGYVMKKYEQNKWVVLIAVIISLLAIFLTDIPNVYGMMATIQWYWYILWYPVSIAGCVVFNNVCSWIDNFGKSVFWDNRLDMPLPILKWVGRHSMTFYVAHYIIFRVVFDWVARYNESWYSGWQGVVIITISYIAIIVPLCFIIDKIKAKYGIK